MKIEKVIVNPTVRQITVEFDNKEYITYSKFGQDLFTGKMHSEGINKRHPYFQALKKTAAKTNYFKNNGEIKIEEYKEIKEIILNFVNQ